ncbi:MAG: anthranilate synthase component I family protein [Thermoanaerobaculia bacterium]
MTAAAARPRSDRRVLVSLERPADLTTPVALLRTLLEGDEPCFLLESVEGGERVARWSFLGTAPSAQISGETGDPFEALRSLASAALEGDEDLPPFTGGAVGYVGYDAVRRLEKLPLQNPDPIGLPDLWFGIFDEIIAFDHAKHRLLFLAHAEEGKRAEAEQRLARLADRALAEHTGAPVARPSVAAAWTESLPRAAYVAAVEQAKESIRAGDIFQVVLSRRWSAPFAGDPFAVYRALRRISPSPYQYFLKTPHGIVFGASPERLVRVQQGADGHAEVETIPLAGTRPRGHCRETDLIYETELLADEKERAEHIMLVDLGRNDVGRVAVAGSVKVKDFFSVERYSHVMHIASRVVGRLRDDRDAVDALAATFPAGTLTGAPKIRAMQLIEELEPVRRGAYGGAVGYLDFAGNLDVAIAIRTAVVKDGVLHVQAGAGIVADSVAESEADECENKARALMKAVELAGEYAG